MAVVDLVGGQRVQGTAGTERYFYFRLSLIASIMLKLFHSFIPEENPGCTSVLATAKTEVCPTSFFYFLVHSS